MPCPRSAANGSRDPRAGQARKFVAQSLQLRNDICNEPNWEAVFSDQEVNAWLAEDLVTHFADQLPPEVNEPRVLFELDRITLAFQLRQRGVQSVITVVARPWVPEGNTVDVPSANGISTPYTSPAMCDTGAPPR